MAQEGGWRANAAESLIRLGTSIAATVAASLLLRYLVIDKLLQDEKVPAARDSGSSKDELSAYEAVLASEDLVDAEELDGEGFASLGGLDEQIRELKEQVVYPLSRPHLFAHSRLVQRPTGVLLYGPPGTGKTALARALAAESKASFLNVNLANLQQHYYGQSAKMIEALWSLARKQSPCVVFCDEIDGFLSTRGSGGGAGGAGPGGLSGGGGGGGGGSEVELQTKTLFLSGWDGLFSHSKMKRQRNRSSSSTARSSTTSSSTGSEQQPAQDQEERDDAQHWVLVIGATNRPWALDPAVLRRMPRQIEVPLPDARARQHILRVLLQHERLQPATSSSSSGNNSGRGSDGRAAVATYPVDLPAVAAVTRGYSGSDLREVVREAVLIGIREALAAEEAAGDADKRVVVPRGITTADLLSAARRVRPTGADAAAFLTRQLMGSMDEQEEQEEQQQEQQQEQRQSQEEEQEGPD